MASRRKDDKSPYCFFFLKKKKTGFLLFLFIFILQLGTGHSALLEMFNINVRPPRCWQ